MRTLCVPSGYKYAVLRCLTGSEGGQYVPVGVVLWNPERRWLQFRLPQEDEQIPGAHPAVATYLQVARAQIEGWFRRGSLPYARAPLEALSDAWWEQVRRLMQFGVRVGPAQAVDCRDPETEIEGLYRVITAGWCNGSAAGS